MFDKLYSVFVTNWYTFCWNYQTLTVSKSYGISFVVLSVVVNFLIQTMNSQKTSPAAWCYIAGIRTPGTDRMIDLIRSCDYIGSAGISKNEKAYNKLSLNK